MAAKTSTAKRATRPTTSVVTAGRDPASYHGFVNPPVYHASTVLYPSAEDFLAHRARYQYGRRGTPTTEALEQAVQELEGPQCAGVALLAFRACGDLGGAAFGRACRRSRARHRQRLRADPRLLRSDPQPARRHHHLLRSADRRRDRGAHAAEHPRGLHRIARLAELRDAGRPRYRRSGPCQRRARADGQYLGHAALLPARWTSASICRSMPGPNISAVIPT